MPVGLIRAYVRQMGPLQAEDMLRQMEASALGSGWMKQADRSRAVDQLHRIAKRGQKRKPAKHVAATPDMLAELGIGFKRGH